MFNGTLLGLARTIEFGVYRLHHTIDVVSDIIVPEPQYAIALGHQPLRSNSIAAAARIFTMLGPVNFYDEASGRAGKIDDEFSDGHLAAEVSTVHFKSA